MTHPRVSVLIPCHNAEAYVADTLQSVLGQTWPDIEVIVVDDGSTDGSASVVERFASQGVRLVRQPCRGASAARNRAFAESTGAFIQFIDADDLIDPDKIAVQMARLADRSDCIASGQWGRFRGDPKDTVFRPEPTWEDLAPVEWLVRARLDGQGMLFPALWLAPRAIVEAAGPWNEALSLGDDGEFFTRAVLASQSVLFCPEAHCRYRSVPGSLSSTRRYDSAFEVVRLCEGHVRAREDSERVRRGFALTWQHLAHSAYPYDRALAERAARKAASLHPVRIHPGGGPVFNLLKRLVGWRIARLLQARLRPG